MASLRTAVAGVALDGYVYNASGPRDTTLEELEALMGSEASAVLLKSCTLEPRAGNPEPRYADLPYGSIQSMGLPNLGYQAYLGFSERLASRGKPVIASVAGLCTDDYVTMVTAFQKSAVDLIEVNLSCPNIPGKPQVGYDFEQTERVLQCIVSIGDKPLGLKLPAYHDRAQQERMAALATKYGIRFLTCINSIGNTLVIDPETETTVIRPKGGFGGLGGACIKPIALANVRAFRELLGDSVSIVGVGGVATGRDAFEFLLAGADAVQVGTAFMQEGTDCFMRIRQELSDFLDRKGYPDIAAAKGKLKLLEIA